MKNDIQVFDHNDIEIIKQKTVFQDFFRIDQFNLRFNLFEGGQSNIITRELFMRGAAIGVLPYDPSTDEVILIEQFRMGALHEKHSPWLIEVIAGMVETGEDRADVAIRESKEEAGIDISNVKLIQEYLVSPGGTTEKMSIYYAEVDASTASGVHGLDHEDEDIKVHVVKRETAFEWMKSGLICNAATIIALQWLMLNPPTSD